MKNIVALAAGVTMGLSLTTAQATDTVTIQLKWVAQAQFAGYFVAREKGFYKDVGLDVTIKPRRRCRGRLDAVGAGVARERRAAGQYLANLQEVGT
jgi:ABC-type nitrate/sulfonate/bicarbonate transport system substrate-binding protein